MSTTEQRPAGVSTLSLAPGQRLDQATFHARYEAMPPGTRAELVGGVVVMPSPVGHDHSRSHVPALVWLSYYAENTPGVEALDNASVLLGPDSEPQPDAVLRIVGECGGRSRIERGFVRGAPELVAEVSHSTRATDLGPKRDDYERAGVLEYVVFTVEPAGVSWHVAQEGRLVTIPPDADGLYRSEAFPGLWLDPGAFAAGDTRGLRRTLDRGLATPEHAAFLARLAEARRSP